MKILPILVSLFILIGYFYVVYRFSAETRKAITQANNSIFTLTYSICLFLPGAFLLYILKDEKYIYFWDYAAYWVKSMQYTDQFFDTPFKALEGVYYSIRGEEYNSLPNLLLSPVNKLFGLNYNSYVFAIYVIYFLPFALILSNIIIKTNQDISNNLKLALPFFILLFTPCLIPIRFGFLDIAGLVYIAIILSVLINRNYLRTLNIKQSVILGILLLLLIFNRRWYAFWFVAFYVSVFLVNLAVAIKTKDKKILLNTCINLFVAGIVPMVFMLCFFYPFFEMSVLKDYKDIYSAYRGGSALHQLNNFGVFYGWIILAIALLGVALSFKKEKSLIGFLGIGAVIIVMLFTRVNDFGGYQHFYLLTPFILIFFIKAVIYLAKKNYAIIAFLILLLANNYFVFGTNAPGDTSAVFSQIEGRANHRTDYYEIDRIANKVVELQNEGNYVYCLASGGVLNEDIVKNIKLPDLTNPVFKLQRAQHVDKRDRFPNELFLANYVITTIPVQVHLGEENQKLVAYFNHEIIDGSLKTHYEKVGEYQLQDNVKAVLLKKISSLNDNKIRTMYSYFNTAYPEYGAMYNINKNILKTTQVLSGDNFGMASFDDESTINLCPGSSRPSQVSFQFDKNDKELTFNATFNNKEGINHDCNPEKDGEIYLTIKEDGRELHKLYLTHRKDTTITLNVQGRKIITLMVDKGKNEDYCYWFKLTNFKVKQ